MGTFFAYEELAYSMGQTAALASIFSTYTMLAWLPDAMLRKLLFPAENSFLFVGILAGHDLFVDVFLRWLFQRCLGSSFTDLLNNVTLRPRAPVCASAICIWVFAYLPMIGWYMQTLADPTRHAR